jgi:hypothetical protein
MNTSLLKNTLPILITSAAKPNDPNSVKLTSFELRRDYTINALKKWQEISPKSSIIICDGSNYCFEKYCKLRNINTNKIEFLSFENHTKRILQLGKGYGESEIIKYALKYSKILNQHEYFVKCTAKLWVSNFNKINTNFYNYSGLFRPYISYTPFKPPKIEYIDTRFYITHKDFYLRYLNNLYDYENFPISIEELFLRKFLELKVKKIFFYSLPVISGVSGGSGKEYNTKLYRVLKDKIRYQIWRNSKFMKDYFIS